MLKGYNKKAATPFQDYGFSYIWCNSGTQTGTGVAYYPAMWLLPKTVTNRYRNSK